MLRTILAAVLVTVFAASANAQFAVNPNLGATFVLKDGKTTRVGEVLADVGYQFSLSEDGGRWGELVALYGIGIDGNQLGGLGFRYYFDQGEVYPGLGAQLFIVDQNAEANVLETSITVAPEILLEIPWTTETVGEDGTVYVEESMIAAYAAYYHPVSGDKDFSMLRFGIRAGI